MALVSPPVIDESHDDTEALVWNDSLTGGERHKDSCAKVASQRRLLAARPPPRGTFASRDDLIALLAQREPCDCGRGRSFTCPACGAVSHHATDIAEGYCGACHDWTGELGRAYREKMTAPIILTPADEEAISKLLGRAE